MTRIHPFPNAKPELLGDPEDSIGIIDTSAVAGLTGDLVMAKVLDSGQQQVRATVLTSFVNARATIGNDGGTRIAITSITTPTEKSTLVIVIVSANFIPVSGNTTKAWLLKRGTTTIDTFALQAADSNSTEADIRLFTDSNPTAGTFDYNLVEDDPNTYGAITMQLFFIRGTDTHAGIITTPATATKQINSPDTHRTHEREVLQ